MLPLGGCLLATDKPDPGLDIPQAYELGPKNPVLAEAAVPPLDWWRGFRSKELTALIEEARTSNLDIAAAVAQIVQADAQSRVAGAPLLPGVALNGSATHLRTSQSTVGRRHHRFAWRLRARPIVDLAHRQLRDRLLGQEPLGPARRRGERGRQPL